MSDASAMGARAQLVLERISRVLEANQDADARTIRKRAGMPRQVGDAALERLLANSFAERRRVNAEWRYRSIQPYRANVESARPAFADSHATRQGGST